METTLSLTQLKAKLNQIYVFADEKLNALHKDEGETLNSRQVLNDFLTNLSLDIDKLTEQLKDEFNIL